MIRFLQTEGPVKKIVLGGLLLLVCAAMVITFIPTGSGTFLGELFGANLTTQGVLAKVGSDDITMQEVAQRARMIGRQQFRGNVPPNLMPFLMQRATEGMITQGALSYEADRMGLGVNDKELADYLQKGQFGQMFFPGGKFIGQDAYENLLQQNELTIPQFEQDIKNGILFRKSPADAHYTDTREVNDPYDKVNNPAPRGRYTWIKTFINGIGLGTQNRENTGWNIRQPQQRTSVWRPLMPGHAAGFAPQTFTPRQLPQTPRWNRDIPIIGTDPYGTGVLNADTFGAGQTAGGIGGSRYTPPPGPPETISTADQGISNSSGMPSWG